MAIGRTVSRQAPTAFASQAAPGSGRLGSGLSAALGVARNLGMVAVAAFGILVLLPAAIAAQAALAR